MEAKDRIIKYNRTECPSFWQGVIDAALKDQDRISFKAGMEEVVEELRLRGDMSMNFPFSNIRKEAWQAFLKELDIGGAK